MKCQHENCTRDAKIKNLEYHPDKWLCTFHANKEKVAGRINQKINKKKYGKTDSNTGND
jgi:hypothetical protein